jgi:Flp pilus assembly protein TadD
MGLGSCYVDLDRAEDAINAYVQAIRVNPRMAPAHCNLGMTYRERWKALFY